MRAVNLLPSDLGRDKKKKKKSNPVVFVAVLGGCLVVSALALGFLFANSTLVEKQLELQGLEAELRSIPPPPPGPTPGEEFLATELSARAAVLASVLTSRVSWDGVLRRFSLVLPEDVWLESLAATAPGADSQGTLSITGHAYSHDGVARLLARLSVVPDLDDVRLASSELVASGDGPQTVTFSISAVVRRGATA